MTSTQRRRYLPQQHSNISYSRVTNTRHAMKDYQSYQSMTRNDRSIDSVEYGSTTLEMPEEAAAPLATTSSNSSLLATPSEPSSPASPATATSSLTSKLGYIFVGFLAGYCNSRGLFFGDGNVSGRNSK